MAKKQEPEATEVSEEVTDKKQLQEEKKRLKQEQKEQRKEAKRRAKELSKQEEELDGDSNTLLTFGATIFIVALWLAVICAIIKLDIGGFGSNVLTPILKDVPVVNKILPKQNQVQITEEEDAYGGYTNLKDAVEQIKKLELELEQAQNKSQSNADTITNLEAEVTRLQEFEKKQVEFQRIKTEFYEEVVYADKGPGAEAYQKYYESMDPTTAEYLYKQVVTQLEETQEVQDYAAAYSAMKPKQAAAIFESMTDNLDLAARILNVMSSEERGKILGVMDSEVAARLTKIMDPET